MLQLSRLLLLSVALFSSSLASAGTFRSDSVNTQNRSPIMQLFELATPDYQQFSAPGSQSAGLRIEVANYLSRTGDSRQGELFIDGETWLTTLEYSYQFDHQFRLELSGSWRGHGEGIFDRFIYDFHDLLHLPQNGRTDDAHDRLSWQLNGPSGRLFTLDSATGAVGDASMTLAWQTDTASQWRFKLGLPFGDFDQQTGNEGVDLGVAWSTQAPDWFSQRDWLTTPDLALWYGWGISYVSVPDALEPLAERRWALSARGGVGWRVLSHWQLKSQLDTHTALFDTNIRELGWIPVQITLASTHNIGKSTQLEWGLVEDLRPRVTPDVVFHLALTQRF